MNKFNTECCVCLIPIHRKPNQLIKYKKFYCSSKCKSAVRTKSCGVCSKIYHAWDKESKFCSRSCANKSRLGFPYNIREVKGHKSKQRLDLLKDEFNFTSCMVEGCEYNKTYDIHRFIAGKDGGQYVVGNMFAICPNHHAEVTRKLITLEKVNDFCLKIRKGGRVV
jgi:hypothetical protein